MQPTPRIGLLPGSRISEIKHILPFMLRTCLDLQRRIGRSVHVHIAAADQTLESHIEKLLSVSGVRASVSMSLDHVIKSDAVIAKSGTNNLELALNGVPFVVVYKTSWVNYLIGRWIVRPRFISLVNILANRPVVREWIQHRARPEKVAGELIRLLSDDTARQQMKDDLAAVAAALRSDTGSPPVLRAVTEFILADMGKIKKAALRGLS